MAIFKSNGIVVEYTDNSGEVLNALKNAVARGLSACGEKAVDYAFEKCPKDTGDLANSITYKVEGEDCYIGTNKEYAPYIEFGTGIYAENGGRRTPWVFKDREGRYYITNGQKPRPFLRPSASQHTDEYKEILKDSLRNA